jgi:hypothetical protein
MKRRMIRAVVLFVVTLIALLVFIGLYMDEKKRVQETYRAQFNTHMHQASVSISSYLNAEGDLPLRYRVILSDVSGADCFAFLMTGLTEEQKITVNELHACLLKYPEQMQDRERLTQMQTACQHISENLDKGFEEAAAIVDAIDKKGY